MTPCALWLQARLLTGRAASSVALLAALAVAACGPAPSATSAAPAQATPRAAPSAAPSPTPLPAPVVDVTTLGCRAGGVTDCGAAIDQAVHAVDVARAGTVYIPPGRFLVRGTIEVGAGAPIVIAGAGRDQTTLVGTTGDLLDLRRDGIVIQDLTLDTQTHDARAAIVVVADHTTLQRARLLCGDHSFCLYYAGPQGASLRHLVYNIGNQVHDIVIDDRYHDDGFSWSYQADATIANVDHVGSRLALYIDSNVVVDGYRYTPGRQAPRGTDGFYITPPSDSVTVRNFVTSGSAGVLGSSYPTPELGSAPRVSTNILIDGERVLGSASQLVVGDVRGLTIENCAFAGSSQVILQPTLMLKDLTVRDCTLPSVGLAAAPGAELSAIAFTNDVFPAFQASAGQDPHSFFLAGGTAPEFTVHGGRLDNPSGLAGPGLSPTIT